MVDEGDFGAFAEPPVNEEPQLLVPEAESSSQLEGCMDSSASVDPPSSGGTKAIPALPLEDLASGSTQEVEGDASDCATVGVDKGSEGDSFAKFGGAATGNDEEPEEAEEEEEFVDAEDGSVSWDLQQAAAATTSEASDQADTDKEEAKGAEVRGSFASLYTTASEATGTLEDQEEEEEEDASEAQLPEDQMEQQQQEWEGEEGKEDCLEAAVSAPAASEEAPLEEEPLEGSAFGTLGADLASTAACGDDEGTEEPGAEGWTSGAVQQGGGGEGGGLEGQEIGDAFGGFANPSEEAQRSGRGAASVGTEQQEQEQEEEEEEEQGSGSSANAADPSDLQPQTETLDHEPLPKGEEAGFGEFDRGEPLGNLEDAPGEGPPGPASVEKEEDGFGNFGDSGFGEFEDAPDEAPSGPAAVEKEEEDDDGFGNFDNGFGECEDSPDEAPSGPAAGEKEEDDDGFGNFGDGGFGENEDSPDEAPSGPAAGENEDEEDEEDGFGNFGGGGFGDSPNEAPSGPAAVEKEEGDDAGFGNSDDGGFGEFEDAPDEAPSGPVAVEKEEEEDDGFGNFDNGFEECKDSPDEAPSGPAAVEDEDDEDEEDSFGDFGDGGFEDGPNEAPPGPAAVEKEDEADGGFGDSDDGGFGDFEDAPDEAPPGPAAVENEEDDDGFGNSDDGGFREFEDAPDEAPSGPAAGENEDEEDEEDGFGDFGDGGFEDGPDEAPPGPSLQVQGEDEDGDDDGFGDFDDGGFGDFEEPGVVPESSPTPPPPALPRAAAATAAASSTAGVLGKTGAGLVSALQEILVPLGAVSGVIALAAEGGDGEDASDDEGQQRERRREPSETLEGWRERTHGGVEFVGAVGELTGVRSSCSVGDCEGRAALAWPQEASGGDFFASVIPGWQPDSMEELQGGSPMARSYQSSASMGQRHLQSQLSGKLAASENLQPKGTPSTPLGRIRGASGSFQQDPADPFAASGAVMSLSDYLTPSKEEQSRLPQDGSLPAPGGPPADGSEYDPFGVFMALQAAKNTPMRGAINGPGGADDAAGESEGCGAADGVRPQQQQPASGLAASAQASPEALRGSSIVAASQASLGMFPDEAGAGGASGLPVSIAVPRPHQIDDCDASNGWGGWGAADDDDDPAEGAARTSDSPEGSSSPSVGRSAPLGSDVFFEAARARGSATQSTFPARFETVQAALDAVPDLSFITAVAE